MPQTDQSGQLVSDSTVRAFLMLDDAKKRETLGKLSEPTKQALLAGIKAWNAKQPKPNVNAKPSASPFAMIGEGEEVGAEGRQRMAEEHPGMLASTALAGVAPALPTSGVVGVASNLAGRAAAGLGGAAYGDKLAREVGLPPWAGRVIGGAAGVLAPEAIGKLSSPLVTKIAKVLAEMGLKASVPEALETIAADTSVEGRIGRDVVERAARGEPLSKMDEEILLQQVQKHYTPEAGVETSAQRAGKVYAGRGSNLRPTNEQLAIAKQRGFTPPPSPAEAAPAAPNRPWEVQTPQVAYRARPVGENGIPKADYPQATTDPAKAAAYAKSLANQTGKPHEVATIDLTKTPKAMRAMQPGSEHMIQFGTEHPESVVVDRSAPVHPEQEF